VKNLTWQNPEQLFVAQELINKVKSKCCGIKENKAGEKRNILFLFASIYFAVNTNRFSPFWISIQSDKLKLNFHLPEKKFLLLFAI